jgi:hypothetical protein
MTDAERKKLLKRMKERTREICRTRESATQYLIDLGIFTKDGKLTENYKNIRI